MAALNEILREEIDAVLKAAEEKQAAAREQAARGLRDAVVEYFDPSVNIHKSVRLIPAITAFDAAWGQK